MTVSKDKVRVMITLDKDFKDLLSEKADQENRSLSNYIETLLKSFINEDS